jgi:hypothetical protein
MKIVKTLTLALAAAIIFTAHAAPSFAAPKDDWIEVLSFQENFDAGSFWDYIMSWLD